ncbi:MAG: ABC transporter substrate-binding protein [Bacilli bacterium]|nr:ABC transporter substrate-binding protein [Bacilli bacterium]MDD4076579.1 ABC transporter substrate-binding protein [Bacilli bacterium]MDD4388158.1 ABC transporter substrate-binding protein [Bacilli bacterium]
MKKLFSALMLFIAVFALVACNGKKDEGSRLTIVGRSHFALNEEVELEAKLLPADDNDVFEWQSSDEDVIKVAPKTVKSEDEEKEDEVISKIGVVETKKIGKATLTVSLKGNKKVKATLDVEVKSELVKPEEVKLFFDLPFGKVSLDSLFIDAEFQFIAQVYPEGADQQIIWSSSDETVATVSPNGLVIAKVNGPVTITASVAGASAFTVKDAKDKDVPLEVAAEYDFNVISQLEVDGDTETKLGKKVQLEAKVNDTFNYDEKVLWSSSNSLVAEVDEKGLVNPKAAGKVVITASVTSKDGKKTRSVSFPFQVLTELNANQLAGGADGMEISFKYATPEVKAQILAALERHLINKGASIPVVNNSGAVVYSDRVTLPTKEFVPIMGFGAFYCTLKDNDADHPYRTYTTANPKTFNHLMYKDSIESDMMTLTELSLFSLEFNDDFDGYVMQASAAAKFAEPVAYNEETEAWEVIEDFDPDEYSGTAWKVTLSNNLFWVDKTGAKKEQIKADDFIYSYMMALDPVQQNSRANYFYSSAGVPIKNGEKYFKQLDAEGNSNIPSKGVENGAYETVDWDQVGVHKVDEFSFVLELELPFQQWDVHYNTTGFLFAPVYKPLFEAGFDKDRKVTNYGSELDKYMNSGAYYMSYWESSKQYRFTKNEHYVYNTGCQEYTPAVIHYTIVKDANAALEMFENNQLDVVNVPATHYEQYKNNAGLKKAPGATAFRFSVNRATQAELDMDFGIGAWETKPILQEDDFMWALYFAMNRQYIAEELGKTLSPEQFYYTQAYVVDPKAGQAYRDTDAGKLVGDGIFEGDIKLSAKSFGYNKALATDYYVKALKSMLQKGVITEGTAKKKTVIKIEIAAFDSVTWTNILDYLAEELEQTFNAQTEYPNIEIKVTAAPQPGMNVYYEKQMKGRYDLALAGISGGLLDPIGLMECFCDDNRSGLLLSLGFDSHNPSILIDLDLDGDGELDGAKYWSFDALYSATAGKVFVKMGVEAEAPAE